MDTTGIASGQLKIALRGHPLTPATLDRPRLTAFIGWLLAVFVGFGFIQQAALLGLWAVAAALVARAVVWWQQRPVVAEVVLLPGELAIGDRRFARAGWRGIAVETATDPEGTATDRLVVATEAGATAFLLAADQDRDEAARLSEAIWAAGQQLDDRGTAREVPGAIDALKDNAGS